LEFGAVAGDPVVLLTYRLGCTCGVQAGHGRIAGCRADLYAAPAAILPPQDRVDHRAAVGQRPAVGPVRSRVAE